VPDSSWFLHIFEVPDAHSQELIAKSFQDEASVVVEPRTCGPDTYVVIGSVPPLTRTSMLRMVLSIEPEATLVYRNEGADPVALWPIDHPALD